VADNPMIEMTEPFGAHETTSTLCTLDQALDGGQDEEIHDSTYFFPGTSCVTIKGTLPDTFAVDENIVSIKIQKMPGIY
jgi:hypothetical protein